MYLLDTNVCVSLINGRQAQVRSRFEAAINDGALITTSVVVLFELWYGVAKSERPTSNAHRLKTFLAGPITVLDLDADDARQAGKVRWDLERIGRPIGAYDLLIAGQALRTGARLVTGNCSEFARIADLSWEDWTIQSPANSAK
jgi:tRNA(fMet)-specific endonuclease VapC